MTSVFPPEVEILTEDGFIRFDSLKDQKVAQWFEDGRIEFVTPERKIVKQFDGQLLQYKHRTISIRTTPKHNLVKINPTTGKVHKREAWDSYGNESWIIPRCGKYDGVGISLSDDQIRMFVAFQADGTFTKGAARFQFKKERKIKRWLSLAESVGLKYNEHDVVREGVRQFYIKAEDVPKYFTKNFCDIPVKDFSLRQKEIFLRELGFWDGTDKGARVRYTSAVTENLEYVYLMAVTAGYTPSRINKANAEGSCFCVDIVWDREKCSLRSAKVEEINYKGLVYCATVPSGMIIVRTDGQVCVIGNCDKHALSYHDSDPDLPSAGDELRKSLPIIQELFEMFPNMDIIESNHGSLVWRKAKTFGIPKHYIKSYNDVLGVDDGWKWSFDLTITLPNGQKCYIHHGKTNDVVKLSQQMGMCAVQGHYHESLKIDYWGNPNGLFWAMQAGCLIDDDALAFNYNNVNIKRPVSGTGVIIDSLPILEPMILGSDGRWIGK